MRAAKERRCCWSTLPYTSLTDLYGRPLELNLLMFNHCSKRVLFYFLLVVSDEL